MPGSYLGFGTMLMAHVPSSARISVAFKIVEDSQAFSKTLAKFVVSTAAEELHLRCWTGTLSTAHPEIGQCDIETASFPHAKSYGLCTCWYFSDGIPIGYWRHAFPYNLITLDCQCCQVCILGIGVGTGCAVSVKMIGLLLVALTASWGSSWFSF